MRDANGCGSGRAAFAAMVLSQRGTICFLFAEGTILVLITNSSANPDAIEMDISRQQAICHIPSKLQNVEGVEG